jgi:hypothetical protein
VAAYGYKITGAATLTWVLTHVAIGAVAGFFTQSFLQTLFIRGSTHVGITALG